MGTRGYGRSPLSENLRLIFDIKCANFSPFGLQKIVLPLVGMFYPSPYICSLYYLRCPKTFLTPAHIYPKHYTTLGNGCLRGHRPLPEPERRGDRIGEPGRPIPDWSVRSPGHSGQHHESDYQSVWHPDCLFHCLCSGVKGFLWPCV